MDHFPVRGAGRKAGKVNTGADPFHYQCSRKLLKLRMMKNFSVVKQPQVKVSNQDWRTMKLIKHSPGKVGIDGTFPSRNR